MKSKILKYLNQIEQDNNIVILLAVESGSKMWGFASKDSDYDVRFIYRHDLPWYLDIQDHKDTIEFMAEKNVLDFSGWDIKKALTLFRKSNPSLAEWLGTDMIYLERGIVINDMRKQFINMNPRAMIYHYLHMARGNFVAYLQGQEINIKKYFYVLRPLFNCEWIERYGSVPPVLFDEVFKDAILTKEQRESIGELLKKKRNGVELDAGKPISEIQEYIKEKLIYFDLVARKTNIKEAISYEVLNDIFTRSLFINNASYGQED